MDAQLETIGARCHYCSRQDFLPFCCAQCSQNYCLNHSAPNNHACPVTTITKKDSSINTTTRRITTATTTSNGAGIEAGVSLKELQAQHLARRHQSIPSSSSSRPSPSSPTVKSATPVISSTQRDALAALRGLGSRFSLTRRTSVTSSSSSSSADKKDKSASSSSSSSRAAVTELKRTARGDAAIPSERRVYLSLSLGGTTRSSAGVPFFVDEQWSVGRALDAVAVKLGTVNENARTRDESRRLHLLSGGLVLEPSQVIGKRVRDGDEVVLFRGTRPLP